MFKTWHVFLFTLVPLVLVFAGVIIGSMHGVDSAPQVFPTQPPQEESDAPPPTPVPGATQIELVAQDLAFDKSSLTATAGEPVQLLFTNEDSVPHNFALYTERDGQELFTGELITGPGATTTYEFDAPQPGNYYFHCDVHPDMNGSFVTN